MQKLQKTDLGAHAAVVGNTGQRFCVEGSSGGKWRGW